LRVGPQTQVPVVVEPVESVGRAVPATTRLPVRAGQTTLPVAAAPVLQARTGLQEPALGPVPQVQGEPGALLPPARMRTWVVVAEAQAGPVAEVAVRATARPPTTSSPRVVAGVALLGQLRALHRLSPRRRRRLSRPVAPHQLRLALARAPVSPGWLMVVEATPVLAAATLAVREMRPLSSRGQPPQHRRSRRGHSPTLPGLQ
jgi:hypothetical protein